MNKNDSNFNAYLYAAANSAHVQQLCTPLFNLGIKVFAYFRFFANGEYLYLCNRLDWLKFCLQNIQDNDSTELGREIGQVMDDYHCYLWPNTASDNLLAALYEHNIWHGLSIFKKNHQDDSIELWGFASDRYANDMSQFYLQHLSLLKKFTWWFNSQAAEIIIPHKANLARYANFTQLKTFDDYDLHKITEFIKATPRDKHSIIHGNQEIWLTTQELDCLGAMVNGKSAKESVQGDTRSYRTIEKIRENLKKKLGVKNRAQLSKIYHDNLLNWLG